MTLLIIGIIIFAVGSYFDLTYSEKAEKVGAKEFNPLERNHDKQFLPMQALLLHVGFAAFVLISHFTWLPDDQKGYTGYALGFVGAVSLVVGLFVDRPLYEKLKK